MCDSNWDFTTVADFNLLVLVSWLSLSSEAVGLWICLCALLLEAFHKLDSSRPNSIDIARKG
jgi:hypothetical protein